MSTLVITHGGLERVTRGVQLIAHAVRSEIRGPVASLFARWVQTYRVRQQERAFEMLMELDPRVRGEVDAAAARANLDR